MSLPHPAGRRWSPQKRMGLLACRFIPPEPGQRIGRRAKRRCRRAIRRSGRVLTRAGQRLPNAAGAAPGQVNGKTARGSCVNRDAARHPLAASADEAANEALARRFYRRGQRPQHRCVRRVHRPGLRRLTARARSTDGVASVRRTSGVSWPRSRPEDRERPGHRQGDYVTVVSSQARAPTPGP